MPVVDKILLKNPVLRVLSKYGWIDNSSGTARFSRARMAERLQEINERKSAGSLSVDDRSDLLSMFLKAQRDDKSGFFDDSRVLTMTTSIALAGSDTAAISLSAVFYHLLRNRNSYRALENEIEEAIKMGLIQDSEVISWTDAQKLPYLDAVIRETFRIHPSISLNLERVTPPEGICICDDFIPGGVIVSCNPWVLHRRRDVFGEDAEAFNPNRWLKDPSKSEDDENSRLREMNAAMLHFGAGSRTCLGKHIALLEMYKLVPSFLRKFSVSLHTASNGCCHLRLCH